jgi:hypothetical protein
MHAELSDNLGDGCAGLGLAQGLGDRLGRVGISSRAKPPLDVVQFCRSFASPAGLEIGVRVKRANYSCAWIKRIRAGPSLEEGPPFLGIFGYSVETAGRGEYTAERLSL